MTSSIPSPAAVHAGITGLLTTHSVGVIPVTVTPVGQTSPDMIGISTWGGDWTRQNTGAMFPMAEQRPLPHLLNVVAGKTYVPEHVSFADKFPRLDATVICMRENIRAAFEVLSTEHEVIRSNTQTLKKFAQEQTDPILKAVGYLQAGIISALIKNLTDIQVAGELFAAGAWHMYDRASRTDDTHYYFEVAAIMAEMSALTYGEARNIQVAAETVPQTASGDPAAFKDTADSAQLAELGTYSRGLAARAWSSAFALHGESHAAARGLWNAWAGRDLKTYAEIAAMAAAFYDPYQNDGRSHESFEDFATSTEYLLRATWAASRRGLDAADWQLASNFLLKAQSSGHEVNVLRVGDNDHTEYDTEGMAKLRDDAGEIFLQWDSNIDLNAERAQNRLNEMDGRVSLIGRELTPNETGVAGKFGMIDDPAEMDRMSQTFPWLTIGEGETYEKHLGIAAAAGDADNKLIGYTAILEAGIRKTLEMQRDGAKNWQDWRKTEDILRDKLELAVRLVRDLKS